MWKVMRHGGRRADEWKCKLETADEQAAREKFDKLWKNFRQGRIQLIDPEGKAIKSDWSPRFRTRNGW